MELKIYNQSGILKLTVSTASSSTLNQELMTENAVSASFTHPGYVPLDVNDYVMLLGVKYSIKKEYKPKQKNTQTYDYSVKFYAPEHDAQQVMYLNLTDGQYNSQFSLDGSPREHMQKWVDNMNRIYGSAVWSIGDVVVADNQTIEYNNVTCWDALTSISEAFGTEWWADGFVINLSRCEHGEQVELGYMQGLISLTQSENSNDVQFFTRLIPLGTTKNIDRSRYGYTRLQLPDKSAYVDRNTHYGLYEHVEEAAFAEIFPHYTGTVASVRSEEKIGEDKKPFTAYYFKDNGMTFDPSSKENEIGGLVKHVSFQTGDLGGRDFEANYKSDTKEWEIINTYPSDEVQIPGGNLIPEVGDTYIPWNFKMPVEYEVQAELDYKAAVDDYLAQYSDDVSKYGGDTDYIYINTHSVPLIPGQQVRLLSDKYFASSNGYRDTRMTKVVRKLDNLSIATIECSNQVGKGWKSQVDSSLTELKYVLSKQEEETVLDILKSWDGREATDYRFMTALRVLKEIKERALSKTSPDRTDYSLGVGGDLTVDGILNIVKMLIGANGSGISVGSSGIVTAIFDELQRIISVVSPDFVSGDLGNGFVLKYDPKTGRSYLEVDDLLVRKIAYFVEVIIKSLRHVGGEIILTPASMKCDRVEVLPEVYRCYFKQDDGDKSIVQEFVAGDQARCQTFNIKEGTSHNVSNKYYWRLVTAIGDDYIDLSKADCDAGSMTPASGDDIVQLGNRNDATRRGAIILSTIGDDAPSFKQYKGIDGYTLKGKEVTILSATLNKLIGEFISSATGKSYDTMIADVQVVVDAVKKQTDKEYTLWFFDYAPTLSNIPASDWNTPELKTTHEQDMFYNRTTGYCYRFMKNDDGSYSWNPITDQQTIKALENAAKAQDTADDKRRVFVSQPTDAQAYDIGDLWTNATIGDYTNDQLVCIAAKASGAAFSLLHWKPSSNSTTSYIKNLGDSILLVVSGNKKDLTDLITQNKQAADGAVSQAAAAAYAAMTKANEGVTIASAAANKALEAFNNAGTAQDGADTANAAATNNATAIQATEKKITALAAKVTFDKSGNIINIDKSGLATTAEMNALITEKFTFDASGKVTNISTSGLVTEAAFSGLFSKQMTAEGVVKRADISTFITADQAGVLISKANIRADQIDLTGAVTFSALSNDAQTIINGKATPEQIATAKSEAINNSAADAQAKVNALKGTLKSLAYLDTVEAAKLGTTLIVGGYLKTSLINVDELVVKHISGCTGDFTGIVNMTSGTIAGFTLEGNGLTNTPFTNDAYIIFRNDRQSCFAGIGGNVLPTSSGVRAVARFENEDSTDQWGLSANYACILSAKNAGTNFALYLMNGLIGGFCLMTRQTDVSTVLTHADCLLSCYHKAEITVSLPASPQLGKVILIMCHNDPKITVSGNGKKIKYGAAIVDSAGILHRELNFYIYDGQYWLNGWFNY